MEKISFGSLWDLLCESLDFVRELEGIVDVDIRLDEDLEMELNRSTSGDISVLAMSMTRSSIGGDQKPASLSSLTMR
jgi:hypothetical protein